MSTEVGRLSPRRSGHHGGEAATDEAAAGVASTHDQNQRRASSVNHIIGAGRYEEDAMAAAADHISTRLNDSLCVSDDEGPGSSSGGKRRPIGSATRRSPLHVRSLSFSVGTTPGKQYPTRFVSCNTYLKVAAVL